MKTERSERRKGLFHKYFALLERRGFSDKLLLQLALLAFLVALVNAFIVYNNNNSVATPGDGGVLVEGIVGTPRFVNPVLATTRADKDMVELIYSGLMKVDPNGELVPDLAEKVELSEDGQTYHVTIRNDAYFHDGTKVTAKDIAYTITLIQNPDLKSPLRGNWEGVLVEELGEQELNIVIREAYAPFLENLTVGIVPRAIWDELPTEQLPFSQNNTNPIGSGPYQIEDIIYNQSGLISEYVLRAANNYQETPHIQTLKVNFYTDEASLLQALEDGLVDSTASLSPENLATFDNKGYKISEHALPRTFAIYFNQNKSPALRDQSVRRALMTVIDRDVLVSDVLYGYGIVTNSPIPQGFDGGIASSTQDYDPITRASSILTDGGWTKNEEGRWVKEVDDGEVNLTVTISTANTPLFDQTAMHIAENWEELGVEVSVAQFEQTDLVQAVIRPRDFQALLFGAEMGRTIDLYPFWHSSQKNDPGLNIAQYTNIEVDSLLGKARSATSTESRVALTEEAIKLINQDAPAIFLFTPTFGYIYKDDLLVNVAPKLSAQHERFANIGSWYATTEKLWSIFSNNKQN